MHCVMFRIKIRKTSNNRIIHFVSINLHNGVIVNQCRPLRILPLSLFITKRSWFALCHKLLRNSCHKCQSFGIYQVEIEMIWSLYFLSLGYEIVKFWLHCSDYLDHRQISASKEVWMKSNTRGNYGMSIKTGNERKITKSAVETRTSWRNHFFLI